MTTAEIANMMAEIGIPTAYYQFTQKTAKAPPFLCFYYPDSRDLYADNSNYQIINHVICEIYTDEKDFALEATAEGVFSSHGLTWQKTEAYIDSEKLCEVIYSMEIVITDPVPEEITEEIINE